MKHSMKRGVWLAMAVGAAALALWLALGWSGAGGAVDAGVPIEQRGDSAPQPEPTAAAAAEPTPQASPSAAAEPAAAPVVPAPAASHSSSWDTSSFPPPSVMGELDKLKGAYEHEPRDSNAGKVEAELTAQFHTKEATPSVLTSLLCRQTVCRAVVDWSRERLPQYLASLMQLHMGTGRELAVEPIGTIDAAGHQEVHVYITRAAGTARALPPKPEEQPAPRSNL
jgi:hypothetical protein